MPSQTRRMEVDIGTNVVLLRLHQRDLVRELDLVADGLGRLPVALADAVAEALDRRRAGQLETGCRAADREWNSQVLRDSAQRELADRLHAGRGLVERAPVVGRGRILLRVEQIRALECLVAIPVLRIERTRLHR